MFSYKRQQLGSPLDKYYTRPHIVRKCLEYVNMDNYDCIIEPAAGGGAFLEIIQHSNIIAMDISPGHNEVAVGDWLKYRISTEYRKVLVIGNPPFGVNHSLSDAFILHALSFWNVQTIAFVLPNTYRKHTRQRILPDNWRIVCMEDLGADAFVYDGKVNHMPCSFFVFDKSEGKDKRIRINTSMYTESIDFYFSNRTDYDFFIFGAVPYKIVIEPTSNNRGYFIKSKINSQEVMKRIQAVKWHGNSCASGGVAWFTKPEIVMQYNNFILSSGLSNASNYHCQLSL